MTSKLEMNLQEASGEDQQEDWLAVGLRSSVHIEAIAKTQQ